MPSALTLRQACSLLRSTAAMRPMQRIAPCRAASSGSSRQTEAPDVRELARLAHIGVTDAEVADWQPKIGSIVDWFGQLQEIDVEGVPPALRADVEGDSRLRPDEPRDGGGLALLDAAPAREGSFVRVPKIATAADDVN